MQGAPCVVLLMGGSAVDTSEIEADSAVGAVMWVGYPGERGGEAMVRPMTFQFFSLLPWPCSHCSRWSGMRCRRMLFTARQMCSAGFRSACPPPPPVPPHDLPQRSAGLVVLARKQKLLGRYRGHMILSTRSFVELCRYKAEYYEGGLSPLDFSMRPNASTHNPGTVAIRLCMNGLRVCVF